jgi:hypothetical protein
VYLRPFYAALEEGAATILIAVSSASASKIIA